jgi:GT2 family glycosyltransferase
VCERSTNRNFEVVVDDNGSREPNAREVLRRRLGRDACVRVIPNDSALNYSRLNNMAVEYCQGRFLVLLNNDTKIATEGSLEANLLPMIPITVRMSRDARKISRFVSIEALYSHRVK